MNLIGREAEQALLGSRLDDRRLVTLVGGAGVGKTTLAHAMASNAGPRFELGSRQVDLTEIGGVDDDVHAAIAGQLCYPGFIELLESPIDQGVLLVVDNCEHVVDAAADAIGRLLDACQAPTVLATSRRPLDLPGETVVHIGPLAVPPAGVVDPEAPAVRLFLTRATDAGVDASALDLEAVCELSRRLDGNALAIEIAAARSRALSPAEILDLLDERLDVLERPRFRGARRHRGLRTAIDWSYRLLDDSSRDLLDHLGALSGPFDLDTAIAVAARDPSARVAALDELDGLVADSLVAADVSTAATKFRLLESVRTYARERLTERDELAPTMDRLVDHLVTESLTIILDTSDQWDDQVVPRLLDLYQNMATAIRWCVAHDATPDRADLLAAILWGVVHQAHTTEIHELAGQVVARWPDTASAMRPDAVATQATATYLLGDTDEARRLAADALPAADASEGSLAPVTLRRVLAQVAGATGDVHGALDGFVEAARLARERGLLALALELEADQAPFLHDLGRTDEALAICRAVAIESQQANSVLTDLWARSVEASILIDHDPPAALAVAEQVLEESRRVEYPAGIAINLRTAAIVQAHLGRPTDAATLGLELLDELVLRGMMNELRMVLDALIAVLVVSGRTERIGDLRVTLDALPTVTMVAREPQRIVAIPDVTGTVLGRAAAIEVVRAELRDAVDAPTVTTPGPGPRPEAPRAGDEGVFRPSGDFFEIGIGDSTALVKTSKGLVDLHRLLSTPGTEVHSLDLAGALVDESSMGGALDDRARREYEARIIELQAELDEADAANDIGRSEKAAAELDALIDQLSSGLGLGGRDRAASTSAERARSSVTQRIRGAIKRIDQVEPRVGAHLQQSVRTGQFCVYDAVADVTWDLG